MKPLFRTSRSLTRPEESGEFSASPRTLSGDAWRQFRKHKLAMGSMGVLLLVVLLVLAGPLVWHTDPEYIDIIAAYLGNDRRASLWHR